LFNYITRRLLIALPSLLGISLILFTVLALAPGDPFEDLAQNPNVPPEVRAALRAQFGLDDPSWQRYFHWLVNMLQGDWGLLVRQPHRRRQAGLAAAAGDDRRHRAVAAAGAGDRAAGRRARGGQAVFVVRPHRQHLRLHRLQPADRSSPACCSSSSSASTSAGCRSSTGRPVRDRLDWWVAQFKQSIMPITVLGLFQAASWMRYVRSSVLDVVRLDYVTTARSKGLPERVVINKHVVRNALIPVVTLVALQMPAVFGGAIVTEQIFRIPGIGSLLIDAILRNDTPVIMAVTFVFAMLVIVFNLVADILYGWLDPRISYR
jgi:peptide/nickel transport system permease protein